jgi:hypothetical protein
MAKDRELRLIVPEKLLEELKQALELRVALGEAIGIVDQFAAIVLRSMIDGLPEKRIDRRRGDSSSEDKPR